MVRFGLIRHARTQWNLEKKIQGRTDIPLCPEGEKEAGRWGDILRHKGYDLILSSSLTRARQTAGILSGKIGADVEYDPDLREQDFGAWEGKWFREIKQNFPGQVEEQELRGWAFCPPGGESRTQVLKRAQKAIERAAGCDKKHILVVSHSSVMKTIIYSLMKRAFMPQEASLIKAYHLHALIWDGQLEIERLNAVKLV